MKKCYFLTEGGPGIGLGHIARCIALADVLKKYFDIQFVLTTATRGSATLVERKEYSITFLDAFEDFPVMVEDNDLVVTDSYNLSEELEFELESCGAKVVAIVDSTTEQRMASVYINPAGGIDPFVYDVHPPFLVFSGPAYAPLRKEFVEDAGMPVYSDKSGVVICFGGTDSENNLLHFARKCHELVPEAKITLVSGSAYTGQKELGLFLADKKNIFHQANLTASGMAELFRTHGLAITSASTVAYEACSCKIPLIVRQTAENQEALFNFLKSAKLASTIDYLDELKAAIVHVNNEHEMDRMLEVQSKWFDGKAHERILNLFLSLVDDIRIRPIWKEDSDLLLKWANDPVTRTNSYHSELISKETHEDWLKKKLEDTSSRLWMAEDIRGPIGMVRIEKVGSRELGVGSDFEISINVGAEHRGTGWGKKILRRATLHFFSEFPGQTLTAWIKKENVSSQNVFSAAGFKVVAEEMKSKSLSVKMTRSE